MTKNELLNKLKKLLDEKGMYKIDTAFGCIGKNCHKGTISDAIECLEASDEQMNGYLEIFREKYPNSYSTIINNGDWLTHSHNRYYVFTAARVILALA